MDTITLYYAWYQEWEDCDPVDGPARLTYEEAENDLPDMGLWRPREIRELEIERDTIVKLFHKINQGDE